jgi:hypothetical protein
VVTIIVILAIGYTFWPQIKATYYEQSAAPAAQPTADTSELDAVKAQLLKLEAELRAAKAAQNVRPVVVQSVPQGEAPQPMSIPAPAPQPAPIVDASGTVVEQLAPAPVVIVHQVSADGTRQSVTGPGACAAGGNVAKRCGK